MDVAIVSKLFILLNAALSVARSTLAVNMQVVLSATAANSKPVAFGVITSVTLPKPSAKAPSVVQVHLTKIVKRSEKLRFGVRPRPTLGDILASQIPGNEHCWPPLAW